MGGMSQDSELRIVRGAHIIWDRNVALRVVVDGELMGTVAANSDFTCLTAPGHHRVQVREDAEDGKSNQVEVQIEAGEVAKLSCSTRPGFGFFKPLLVGRMFRPRLRAVEHNGRAE